MLTLQLFNSVLLMFIKFKKRPQPSPAKAPLRQLRTRTNAGYIMKSGAKQKSLAHFKNQLRTQAKVPCHILEIN